MLQVRKSRVCGISVIFFQCRFMSETQLSMTVSDFGVFFISSWKWALLSNRGGASCFMFTGCQTLSQSIIVSNFKENVSKLNKMAKNLIFSLIQAHWAQIFFHFFPQKSGFVSHQISWSVIMHNIRKNNYLILTSTLAQSPRL